LRTAGPVDRWVVRILEAPEEDRQVGELGVVEAYWPPYQ